MLHLQDVSYISELVLNRVKHSFIRSRLTFVNTVEPYNEKKKLYTSPGITYSILNILFHMRVWSLRSSAAVFWPEPTAPDQQVPVATVQLQHLQADGDSYMKMDFSNVCTVHCRVRVHNEDQDRGGLPTTQCRNRVRRLSPWSQRTHYLRKSHITVQRNKKRDARITEVSLT